MSRPARWVVVGARPAADRTGGPGEVDADSRIAEALLALGGRAVQEIDGWLETHLPADGPDAHAVEAADVVARLRELTGLADLQVRTRVQAHEDWAELWKRGLAPRRVGRRFVVTPSWCDPAARPGDEVLVLDPGMAFGNAEHGTTRGCLRLLEVAVAGGDRVLDVGSGSGVLAIAAARLGAGHVVAFESDGWAIDAALENLRTNAVQDRVDLRHVAADAGSLGEDGPVDGVVANIELGVLTPLLPGFSSVLREGGWLIMSGILDRQLDVLLAAAEAEGFTLEQIDDDGEWRSVLLRR